jgi:class 3 adenylate cyclase
MLSDHSTIDVIKRSRRRITILFSDIEDSTRHWERRGDVDARMLIDRHNRLLFPVIRKFRGRIIKTLGDAIMAAFDNPNNAVKAAMAMQQVLERERERDPYLSLRTRIGLHTGTGLVEEDDIFGDVVNVAAKVQAEAEGNQILLTSSTAAHLNKNLCTLSEFENLKPKGKRKPIQLLECQWRESPSLITHIRADALLPLMKRQKFELLTYLAVSLCALFFIYYQYLRYTLAEHGIIFTDLYASTRLPTDTLPLLAAIALFISLFFVYLLRIHFISRTLLRMLNGMFGFGLVLFCFHALNLYFQPPFSDNWYGSLHKSDSHFVEVLADNTPLKADPASTARTLRTLSRGEFFVYQGITDINSQTWYQVTRGDGSTAWIAQRVPPAFGVEERQLSLIKHFSFYYYDLYALIFACIGFVWGFMNFSIRPN